MPVLAENPAARVLLADAATEAATDFVPRKVYTFLVLPFISLWLLLSIVLVHFLTKVGPSA